MNFARRLFLFSGIYGVLVLAPLYFLEQRHAEMSPPAITHPEYYYGFVGVGLAWQVMYLLVSREPSRLRPAMLVGAAGKATFTLSVAILFALGRTSALTLATSLPDLLLAALFVVAWKKTPEP